MKILNVYSLKDTVKTIKRLTDWYKNVCTLYNWQKELGSEKIHIYISLVETYISYVYEREPSLIQLCASNPMEYDAVSVKWSR